LGVSAMGAGEVNEVAAIKIGDTNLDTAYWEITQAGGQNLGTMLDSPAIQCSASGTTYVADMLGKVFRFGVFATGSPDWKYVWERLTKAKADVGDARRVWSRTTGSAHDN